MKNSLLRKIFSVVFIIFAIISLSSLLIIYSVYINNSMHEADLLFERFTGSVAADRKALEVELNSIIHRKDFQEAFISKDRDRLLSITSDYFQELKDKFNFTHFYFHTTDLKNFLRVHKPEEFGDDIKRYTLKKAAEEKRLSAGLELGLTAFALRVVTPVYKDSQLIGYQEVGQEIDKILEAFKISTGADISLIVKDDFVSRESFKEDQIYKNHIVLASSGDTDFTKVLAKIDYKHSPGSEGIFKPLVLVEGKYMFLQAKKLIDAGDRDIGDIVILSSAEGFVKSMLWSFLIIIVIFSVSTVMLLFLLNKPIKSLKKVVAAMEVVKRGNGDLTGRIPVETKDEIGLVASMTNDVFDNFSKIIAASQNTVRQVSEYSVQLDSSAQQTAKATKSIAANITDFADTNRKQAAEIQDISKRVAELGGSIEIIANDSEAISNVARNSKDKADKGNKMLGDMNNQMDLIYKSYITTSNSVSELENYSKSIEDVNAVITNIASQTNLLALNAAIEAARAGEAGKGFGVVSDEIRKLAEQTANSSKSIKEMIQKITLQVMDVKGSTDSGVVTINEGRSLINEANDIFKGIINSVDDICMKIVSMSDNSRIIYKNSTLITSSIAKISDTITINTDVIEGVAAATEEQTATMQEITASVEQLSKTIDGLKILIGNFKL